MSYTEDFLPALVDGGHEVQVEHLEGAAHNDVFRSEVVLETLTGWVEAVVLGS